MRKTGFSKKLTASVCTLALALSMPTMALASTETDVTFTPGTGGIDPGSISTEVSGTVAGSEFNNISGNISAELTYDSDLTTDSNAPETNADTGDLEFTETVDGEEVDSSITQSEILEAIPTDAVTGAGASEAYQKAIAGELAAEADNIKDPANDVIGASTFKVDPKNEGTGAAITVVYKVENGDAGAFVTNVKCVAYITLDGPNGAHFNKVVDVTGATPGEYTLDLAAEFGTTYDSAVVTFMLSNDGTAVQDPDATTGKDMGEVIDDEGNSTWNLDYTTGTVSQRLPNGKIDWSASATATVNQADATVVPTCLSIANSLTANGLYTANAAGKPAPGEEGADYAKVINVQVGSTVADLKDITGTEIQMNIGMPNRAVTIFYQEDGQNKTMTHTSDADGNIIIPVADMGVYTVAVANGSTPVVPDTPVIPDVPGTDDQPTLPGEGSDAANGTDSNEVAAADNGMTSPKTGIF